MKLTLNESERLIEIRDGLKNQYLILKMLLLLNVANAAIQLFGKSISEYGRIEYFWIGIAAVSLLVLAVFLFKMSAAETISIEQISRLEEKTFFGRKRLALKLTNGKKRNLGSVKTPSELAQARALFTKVGIAS